MANNSTFHGKKISIIGLGLIGGSLAKAFRRLGICDITGINRNMASIEQAIGEGIISRGFSELNSYVYESDIIFICTPVKMAIEYLDVISEKVSRECIITDVGSTKAEIAEHIGSMPNPPAFIGGHPMAGTEKTGYPASFPHLFENAYYVLSPAKSTNDYCIQTMVELVKSIGAIPVLMDAKEHDRVTGTISHVPHVIASSLVNMVKKYDSADCKMQMLAAGGFRDITRIASSSPEMWENIISSNREQIGKIIDQYIDILNSFKLSMDKGDRESIYGFFEEAKIYRDSFSSVKRIPSPADGLINPIFDIIVDVVDEPGIIGEIATILGSNKVNIKNINVSNNREFEQGCLKITLPDSESVNISFDLLDEKGYKVYKSN